MKPIRLILVTTDFSETAAQAFGWARGLAQSHGAKLVLLHVHEDRMPPFMVEYGSAGYDDILAGQRAQAAERLKQMAADLGDDVEASVKDGIPHVEIVNAAEECGADLIVMATHGRGFFSHAVMGSTTERVIRRAPCAVLSVRDTHVG